MKFLSEFSSPTAVNGPALTAKVYLTENKPFVEFYRDDELVKTQLFPTVTLQHAEDAAENYVMGYDGVV